MKQRLQEQFEKEISKKLMEEFKIKNFNGSSIQSCYQCDVKK